MADAKSPPPQDEHGWSIWVAVAFVLLSLVIAPLLVWAMGVFEWRTDLGLGMLEFGMLAMISGLFMGAGTLLAMQGS